MPIDDPSSCPCASPEADHLSCGEAFRLLVESVEDSGLFMMGPDGRMVSWNAGAERLSGYLASEILGRHCAMFFLEEELAAGLPQRLMDEAEARGKTRDEGWRLRRDGSRFYAVIFLTALWEADGRLRGFAGVVRDITVRRETEAQLREATRRAEQTPLVLTATRMFCSR